MLFQRRELYQLSLQRFRKNNLQQDLRNVAIPVLGFTILASLAFYTLNQAIRSNHTVLQPRTVITYPSDETGNPRPSSWLWLTQDTVFKGSIRIEIKDKESDLEEETP